MFLYVLVLLSIVWLFAWLRLIPKPIQGIPYNRLSALAPWGELVALGIYNLRTGEVFSWLSLQCLKQKSPIVQLFIPSFSYIRPVLVVADVREIEDIVTKRLHEIDRAPLMHDFFGLLVPDATIGMSTGSAFKSQRRLWNSMLSPAFIREVAAPKLHQTVIELANMWQTKADIAKGCAFEAGEDIRMATLDAIWNTAVGSDLGLLDANVARLSHRVTRRPTGAAEFAPMTSPPFYRALRTLLTCLDWVMQGISPRAYSWLFRHMSTFLHAEKLKNEALDSAILDARQRLRNVKQPGIRCALDQVLWQSAMLGSKSQAASSDQALRDELFELLITGHETTASSISWGFKYLTDHPEIQTRLRISLYAAYPNASTFNLPSAEELLSTRLPYLDAVIGEVMRHSRTGPVSFRQTMVNCEILGHQIPSGTPIILVTAGPSYDDPNMPATLEHIRSPTSRATYFRKGSRDFEKSYNLNDFVPERWLQDDRFDAEAGLSLPFSAGPRGCFGKKIALLEMRLMIALLVMRFELPKLPRHLSKYSAKDGLTRRPTCFYVRPMQTTFLKRYGLNSPIVYCPSK